jgi:hypothetical protein
MVPIPTASQGRIGEGLGVLGIRCVDGFIRGDRCVSTTFPTLLVTARCIGGAYGLRMGRFGETSAPPGGTPVTRPGPAGPGSDVDSTQEADQAARGQYE